MRTSLTFCGSSWELALTHLTRAFGGGSADAVSGWLGKSEGVKGKIGKHTGKYTLDGG